MVEWWEFSPIAFMYERSLSPIGAIKTIAFSGKKEQQQRLIRHYEVMHPYYPAPSELIAIGKTAKTVKDVIGKAMDWKTWAIIGGGAILLLLMLKGGKK